MKEKRKAKKIIGLNSLRFFAFLSVFLFHSSGKMKLGYLGVDFFFVLSSFLLTYLAFIEINNSGQFSRFNFFFRRVLRIFPLYFFIVFSTLVVLPAIAFAFDFQVTLPVKKYLYWLFLSNYDKSDSIYAIKFLWSIGVEEQFYLLFLLLSFLFIRHFSLSLMLLFSTYFVFMMIAENYQLSTYSNTITHFSDFGVGMIAGYLFFKNPVPIKWSLPLFLLVSATLIHFNFGELFFHLFISIWFALLILIFIQWAPKLNKFRFFRTTESLGKYSYGLYVYSGFVITLGNKFLPIYNEVLLISIELILIIIISVISFQLFEMKFLQLKKYFR